jgi:FkbH-like protein
VTIAGALNMVESIRLVIWDLDETYWHGTLTEGGITYRRETHDIVVELARRGIMSSICSKNEFDAAQRVLVKEGIWTYFIFPSIAWEPKGPRIKGLVDDVQLRPETIMFIDDNIMNLREATFFVPGLRTADQHIIPGILSNPLFQGKADNAFSRLQQYRILEKKKVDKHGSGDNIDFLRSSHIRLFIEHDVEKHLDRAIELINRTNQLNFTKRRLSEHIDVARSELSTLVSRFDIQAGLVRVRDDYGDYGLCGFFAVQAVFDAKRLLHFCFSCRTLDMGVEAFVDRVPPRGVGTALLSRVSCSIRLPWMAG